MQTGRTFRQLVACLALGAPVYTGCGPSAPASPAYVEDVLPIFKAHCTRCHGDGPDGGMLHDPLNPVPDGGPLTSDPVSLTGLNGFLTQYVDSGDCTVDGAATNPSVCHLGALSMATMPMFLLSERIHGQLLPMPPPPAARLDSYELSVMDAWISHPICSRAQNPAPNVCPPGVGP